MALRFRKLRETSRSLRRIYSGYYHQHRQNYAVRSFGSPITSLSHTYEEINKRIVESRSHFLRYSTTTGLQCKSPPENVILPFIKSTLDEPEGPNHVWLNTFEENKAMYEKDEISLVLAGQFLTGPGSDVWLENVKTLQQRFPQLHVIGFQCCCSLSASEISYMAKFIMKEYVPFPILLSKKIFEMEGGLCYIIFKDFKNPMFFYGEDVDSKTLRKAIEDLHGKENEKSGMLFSGKATYLKQAEVFKEPYSCSFMQNFLLHFPGCISADEKGGRLFLSDSNHHRIIIFNGSGKILDVIGSYPGFEDGEFEFAKLARPAASFYHSTQNCLYFVDSENHAVRKADLEKRVLETLYPTNYSNRKSNQIWSWITDKLGLRSNADKKHESEDFNPQSLMFPWHMISSVDNRLLILNRSLQTLWTMDMASGKVVEVVRGFSEIMENCGKLVMDKVSILKQIPNDWLQLLSDADMVTKGLPYANLFSSFTPFQNYIIICDTVGQGVLKCHRKSGEISSFQFSNFGVLGFPYWFASPLEKVIISSDSFLGEKCDHLQFFKLLPGRVGIQINVDLPSDVELVESLQENSIWRQARGTATEISVVEDVAGPSEKVGAAQQWYDELDSLAFSPSESEVTVDDSLRAINTIQDDKVHIECAVNTSPGVSEVIVYAALYLRLRLRRNEDSERNREKYAVRIANLMYPGESRGGNRRKECCVEFLSKCKRDLRELIFIKPLHVRVRLDSLDHPKAENSKGIILTDSSVEVNFTLSS